MVNAILISLAVITISITSCGKVEKKVRPSDTLKFGGETIYVSQKKDSKEIIMIMSNLSWKFTVNPPPQGWMTVNRNRGNNTKAFVITTTEDNATGNHKNVTNIASPIKDRSVSLF